MVSTSSLRLTANDMDVPLLLVGRDHRISFANQAAHELFGYESGALHGLPLTRLVPSARHGELQNVSAVLHGQTARRVRSAVTRADGLSVDVSMALEACVDDHGNVIAVSVRYEPLRATGGFRAASEHAQATPDAEHASGFRLDPARATRLVAEQLEQVSKLLELLDEQLVEARKEPHRLEHLRGVLHEAREVLEECQLDLSALAPTIADIPKPPRVPRE